jgi:nicotinate-nucleotide pyrophosphorylase (carboxylating)
MDILFTSQIQRLFRTTLEEDIGPGDLTTLSTIPSEHQSTGVFRAKGDCVVAGLPVLQDIFALLDPTVRVKQMSQDGDSVTRGTVVAEAVGSTRVLLMGERTTLNILQRLSGTATLTRRYVDAVKDFSCKIIDTRKTTPGLRTIEKYAVRMGGGMNHRLGLYDAALIKDNHIAAAGSIVLAVQQVRRQAPFMAKIEVECGDLRQVQDALDAGADVIMLDNMDIQEMAQAVILIDHRVWVEASGGITVDTVREVAQTGVDFISVGAVTHSAPAADFNMKLAGQSHQ